MAFRFGFGSGSDADVAFIRELIAAHPTLSRGKLSVKLCEAWGVRRARRARRRGCNLAEVDLRPLVGANGEAETDLLPRGRVNVRGLTFDAQAASGMIDRGAAILVIDIDGGRLTVERARR